ncbi:hypothetical protein DPD11_13485 [Salmonella enterica subsp. salamae]|nr:hypothetical protein [Salmonella enterica]ECI4072034.1 hypothetical protein [Salmonella enterica subsp. salamae]
MKKYNFHAIFLIVLLYCAPILLGTSYYYDDLFRAYSGYSSWNSDGRPFANLFYQIITFGQTMPDTFPLPIVIALAIFAYIGFIFGKEYSNARSLAYVISYAMLIMSPMFVSNLLFRYDSAFMILAVASSISPYTLNLKRNVNIVIGIIFIVLSFGLYQAAVSIFIAFAGIEVFRNSCDSNAKHTIKICLIRIAQLAVAYIIYSKIILELFVINDYFKSFNKPIELNTDGISHIVVNITASIYNIKLLFSPGMLISLTPISAYSVYCFIKFIYSSKKILPVFGFLSAIVAISIAIPGIAIFGEAPIFYPRIYIGFGAFLFFVCIVPCMLNGNNKVTLLLQMILTFYLFGFINATCNAVRADIVYQRSTSQRIINVVDEHGLSAYHNIVVLGQLRQSPLSFVNTLSYPLISVISPQYFINGYDGARFMLMHEGLDNVEYLSTSAQAEMREKVKHIEPVFAGNLFSIYNIDNTIVISFENTIYDHINKGMIHYKFKNSMINNAFFGDKYFYVCLSNFILPELKRNEWYYLLFHTKSGDVINRNFFLPYNIKHSDKTCVTSQWQEAINVENISSIEFGIYNIQTMQRRIDLGD